MNTTKYSICLKNRSDYMKKFKSLKEACLWINKTNWLEKENTKGQKNSKNKSKKQNKK